MNFDEYKRKAILWARNNALKDPTFEFSALHFARTMEDPGPNGSSISKNRLYPQLCSFLKQLEKQEVLVKTRKVSEKIGIAGFLQTYFTFKDVEHPIILRLVGLFPSKNHDNRKDASGSDRLHDPNIFDTAFAAYNKIRQIGQGGSGIVFEVINEDKKPFALKLLSPRNVELLLAQDADKRPSHVDIVRKEILTRAEIAESNKKIIALESKDNEEYPEIDDPLYKTPIRAISVDYNNFEIYFKLNHELSSVWIEIFNRVSKADIATKMDYPRFVPHLKTISFALRTGQNEQKIADDLKEMIQRTNEEYRKLIEHRADELRKKQKEQFADKIKQEKRRKEILSRVKL